MAKSTHTVFFSLALFLSFASVHSDQASSVEPMNVFGVLALQLCSSASDGDNISRYTKREVDTILDFYVYVQKANTKRRYRRELLPSRRKLLPSQEAKMKRLRKQCEVLLAWRRLWANGSSPTEKGAYFHSGLGYDRKRIFLTWSELLLMSLEEKVDLVASRELYDNTPECFGTGW